MKFGGIKSIRRGDVVIIRTGWSALFGTDASQRARHIGVEPGIYRREAIRIGEAFNSEELAADRVYEFVFFYTPQHGKGATASNTRRRRSASRGFRGRK